MSRANQETFAPYVVSSQHQRIQIDALWKPLLRLFRRTIKASSLQIEPEKKEASHSGSSVLAISQSSDQRDPGQAASPEIDQIYSQAVQVMESLGLPSKLHTRRNAFAVLLLVEGKKWSKKRQLTAEFMRAAESCCEPKIFELCFFRIFYENSHEARVTFFSEPIVQELWQRFLKRQPAGWKGLLDKYGGESKFKLSKFKKSVSQTELRLQSFRIFPRF
jgi:hypothetical protein